MEVIKRGVIVSLALSETIGIYGLVLFWLGDDFQTLHIFIGISALAMFFIARKEKNLKRWQMRNLAQILNIKFWIR